MARTADSVAGVGDCRQVDKESLPALPYLLLQCFQRLPSSRGPSAPVCLRPKAAERLMEESDAARKNGKPMRG